MAGQGAGGSCLVGRHGAGQLLISVADSSTYLQVVEEVLWWMFTCRR
jgi:hypothetical protein